MQLPQQRALAPQPGRAHSGLADNTGDLVCSLTWACTPPRPLPVR